MWGEVGKSTPPKSIQATWLVKVKIRKAQRRTAMCKCTQESKSNKGYHKHCNKKRWLNGKCVKHGY